MLKVYTEYNDLVSNRERQQGSIPIEAYPSRSTNFWVFIVYSLVIPTQFFIYHPHGKKSLSHLALEYSSLNSLSMTPADAHGPTKRQLIH